MKSREVQRILVAACPKPEHPKYFPWQTARICVLVGEDDREMAVEKAKTEIGRKYWQPKGAFEYATVKEDFIRECDTEEVVTAYEDARSGKIIFLEWFDQMPMAKKDAGMVFSAPKIGELFIDDVIESVGGKRLSTELTEKRSQKCADYLLSNVAIELKDIQSEGLLVKSRQEKLTSFLSSVVQEEGEFIDLSRDDLTDDEWRTYVDILGGPIKNQIKSAARQLKETRSRLGCLRCGVIFLNTGYLSIPSSLFASIVRRYCEKDTNQIDFSICISSRLLTNGFESELTFSFDPSDEDDTLIMRIREGFWKQVDSLMSDFAKNGFQQDRDTMGPLEPIAFSKDGVYFSTHVPRLQSELDEKWKGSPESR
ncbi:hypothetical protein [Pelagicoccus mobilis]|uniref:Uncharacterized protein n=1 Tax=Pelagicoccus mobilis TaxID=415221 RepID=A0A934S788_9BACT|nr:hypothetical protein [Pelagicoccus mobilis]MBK1880203.1 hypothetical protein [Pelagicoccus mobilis]